MTGNSGRVAWRVLACIAIGSTILSLSTIDRSGGLIPTCTNDSNCDDGNPCTSDSCFIVNATIGTCLFAANDSLSCTDGLFCTGKDRCSAGSCVSDGDPCADQVGDADADCSESCDEQADDCVAPDPDGSSCELLGMRLVCVEGACDDGDGVPADEEQPVPDFDGNGDGIPDWLQPHVTTLDRLGPTTLVTPPDCVNQNQDRARIRLESELPIQDPSFRYPRGLLEWGANCTTSSFLNVTVLYHGLSSLEDASVRKFNRNTLVYEPAFGGSTGSGAFNTTAFFIRFFLPDNGPQDADPANLSYLDPVGAALQQEGAVPAPAVSAWALSLGLLTLAGLGFLALRRRGRMSD